MKVDFFISHNFGDFRFFILPTIAFYNLENPFYNEKCISIGWLIFEFAIKWEKEK